MERRLFFAAAYGGSLEVVRFLIEKGADINARDDRGETALHSAARGGSLKAVRFLVEKGADINARNMYTNKTPLSRIIRRSGKKYEKIANYLRSHGGTE